MCVSLRKLCDTLQKPNVQRWMTYIGLFLINLPGCVAVYYGNLLTYTASYLRVRVSEDVSLYVPVVLSVYVLLFCVGLTFSKIVSTKCGKPLTMLLGIVTYDLGTLLGLWTVQHSVLAQTITQGVMPGTGLGIIMANSMDYTLAWPAGKHLGLVLTISTNTNFGATGINYIVSSFINPENHSPDLETDHTTYFTQEDVLDSPHHLPASRHRPGEVEVAAQMTSDLHTEHKTGLRPEPPGFGSTKAGLHVHTWNKYMLPVIATVSELMQMSLNFH